MSECLCADPDHVVCWVPGNNPNMDCRCCRRTRREIMRLRREPATVQDMPRCAECGFIPDHQPGDAVCLLLQAERTRKHGEC